MAKMPILAISAMAVGVINKAILDIQLKSLKRWWNDLKTLHGWVKVVYTRLIPAF